MSAFFSYEERLELQRYLTDGMSFKEIARILGRDPTGISREIRKYNTEVATGFPGMPHNSCRKRGSCRLRKICGNRCSRNTEIDCRFCTHCNGNCAEYKKTICMARFKPPYVCNGCMKLKKCTLVKNLYTAEKAHIKAHDVISQSRSGLCVSEEEVARINKIISPLIERGQSINHIYMNHQDELMCSEKTLYNYIDACLFDVRNIDLPRKVRFRERYKKPEFKVDKGCRLGRNYNDFRIFVNKYPENRVVQIDTVIGSMGGKCLLTIHFVESSFMLAFLREANTSKSVTDIFDYLDKVLGQEKFEELFPVILTDNGSEFSNPLGIEMRQEDPKMRTNIFYCDVASPHQKGAIEVNHELIRRILPKGFDFSRLKQEDITLMMNHINSYKRKKLNNRSPYEVFSFYHGEEVLCKLGCELVGPSDIMLKPKLLKK